MEAIISLPMEQSELLSELVRRLEELETKIGELELQIQSLRSEA
jgi:chaperonin cofactor prefoldin